MYYLCIVHEVLNKWELLLSPFIGTVNLEKNVGT